MVDRVSPVNLHGAQHELLTERSCFLIPVLGLLCRYPLLKTIRKNMGRFLIINTFVPVLYM